MKTRRPTIRDVADKAGLSLSTVSLVINNRGYVKDDTRERVQRVVAELNYHPTRAARGLASRTSGNIGFILTEDHFSRAEPFYTRIFLGTEFEARHHNYYILLTTVDRRFDPSASVPRFLLERNVDGIIIAGRVNEKLIEYIDGLGLPVILIDYDLRHGRYSSVLIDNRRGAQLAVRHLVELGHRAIGFIGGDPDHPSMAHRYGGYRDTLHECGIPFDERMVIVDEKDTRVRNGVAATERLLQSGARPTAIFAANDAMAIGCLQVAKRKGMVVPRDLAVVGFDDIEISSHIDPHLTTVRVFKEDLGKIAVQRIVDVIKTGSPSVVTTLVPVELVVRDSTVGKAVPSAVTGSATVL